MRKLLQNISDGRKALQSTEAERSLVALDDEKRGQLQKVLLDIYKDIEMVCRENGLTAFLCGGSALGAIRHKGFIPWDDDLDVAMTREDYIVFRKVFHRKYKDKYIINAPNYSKDAKTRFVKILKKGTVCREIVDSKNPDLQRIAVDIFLIEKIPANRMHRFIKGSFCNVVEFISSQVILRESKGTAASFYRETGNAEYLIRMGIGTLFSFANSSAWFNVVDKIARYDGKTDLYGFPTGRKHYFGEIFTHEILFPPTYVDFCDMKAPIFHDYDAYLRNLYGDYMQVPPPEKRERHYFLEINMGAMSKERISFTGGKNVY